MRRSILALTLGISLGAGGVVAADQITREEITYTQEVKFEASPADLARLADVAREHDGVRAKIYTCRVSADSRVLCRAVVDRVARK